jgi:hypothetical protein
VLAEIEERAHMRKDLETTKLCAEAIDYAQRMSAKLSLYRRMLIGQEKELDDKSPSSLD